MTGWRGVLPGISASLGVSQPVLLVETVVYNILLGCKHIRTCTPTVQWNKLFSCLVTYTCLSICLSITDYVQKRQESWPHVPEKVDSGTSRTGSDKSLPCYSALFTGERRGCGENQQTQLLWDLCYAKDPAAQLFSCAEASARGQMSSQSHAIPWRPSKREQWK